MKKLFVSLVAVFMTVAAMAQMPQFNPEDMAKRQVEHMKETLKLNDDQYKAIYELFMTSTKKMQAEMDSVRQAGGDMRQAFDMEKMRKRQEEQNAAIKAILTEEQYAAYEKMQSERRRRFGGNR